MEKGLLHKRNSPSFSILFLFCFCSVRQIRVPVRVPDPRIRIFVIGRFLRFPVIEVMCHTVYHNIPDCHASVSPEIIPVSVRRMEITCHHRSASVKIIPLPVVEDPSGLHVAVFVKVIPLAVYLFPCIARPGSVGILIPPACAVLYPMACIGCAVAAFGRACAPGRILCPLCVERHIAAHQIRCKVPGVRAGSFLIPPAERIA
jgi:hypothetical protein